ncbi:hypothetical protein LSUE1_G005584 [Lachnellula suecica]|uniref:Uncharacterized protein n=1 Tax=Lachnellula suecica TaxID=602035 RepID=A0A8T9CKU9_9HELO|nr:hypothetical protein LSUE1_G005584 [Lachnellula suecica]
MLSFARTALMTSILPLSVFSSYVSSLPENAQGLFNESMEWMDDFYDPRAGYLLNLGAASALRHETRSSAWYAIGLLARNTGSDVDDATKILTNVVAGQFKDPKDQWYGDYQQEPEEPTVGTVAYPAKLYNSWDPNWRGFVGTTLIIGLEEFGHLLSPEVTSLLEESLYNTTVGDTYRVGGVDGDNLYPAYTNPSLMRAFVSGWTGRRLNDSNMTVSGENYANEIITLFNRSNTLSEFNSGTYTGVSLYGLTLWAKYLPEDSVMKQMGSSMVKYTWESVSELWHPQLKNVAGPWDRSYGFDMNRYLSLLALHLWNIIGKEKSSIHTKVRTLDIDTVPTSEHLLIYSQPSVMSHSADFAYAPLFAILAEFHSTLVPADVVEKLTTFQGEHTFTSSTFSPPFDLYPRNITAWLAPNISIGAETFNETVIGGPAINPDTFNPALIQWYTGAEVGFITLYATEPSVVAVASAGSLELSYPRGSNSSIFSIIVSTFAEKKEVSAWEDVQGLTVNVTGNVDANYSVAFAGAYGGADDTINDFEFWNFTYTMPSKYTGQPHLLLEVELR